MNIFSQGCLEELGTDYREEQIANAIAQTAEQVSSKPQRRTGNSSD
jgi:hypothetical protein